MIYPGSGPLVTGNSPIHAFIDIMCGKEYNLGYKVLIWRVGTQVNGLG